MGLKKIFAGTAALMLAAFGYAQVLPSPAGASFVPGEILVQFKATVTDADISGAFREGGLGLIKHIQTPAMKDHGQIGLTHMTTTLLVSEAVRILNHLPGVEFAEPNGIYALDTEANDPFYTGGSLWGMYGDDLPFATGPDGTTNPFGCQAEKAWAAGYVGSADVVVGIVDSGIQFDHPDLAANVWTNPGEIPGNGIDDDGDGYVDDVHGWNSDLDNGIIYAPGFNAHGTHVAGTIGAVGGNGSGVAGVNWKVTLVSGTFGNNTVNAVEAIDYMTALRTKKGLNIVALNNSWGSTDFSQSLLDAITRAAQAGIVFVASAGNSSTNMDLTPHYPAAYDTTATAGFDSVVSVAASDQSGNLASFSNYGQTSVDLAAPGVSIYSSVPTNSYAAYNGTSMSAPHVTGAVALYASTHPGASVRQTRSDLLSLGVNPTASLQGMTASGGRLDLSTLIPSGANGLAVPLAPANLVAGVISAARVDLTWADQSDNELGFAIERSTDGQTYVLADTVGANFTSYSDRRARPATSYYYRVRAYNPGGSSDFSYAPAPVTTPNLNPPGAPSGLTATAQARGGVALSWKDNANNEDGFQVERKIGTNGTWQPLGTVSANSIKYTDSTTATRTSYTYRVRGFNAAWVSAYSNEATARSK